MQISSHCFAIMGLAMLPPWMVNAGFIVGKSQTLIVDTGANVLAAATIYGYASSVRPANRLIVLNTEQHLDHLSGNAYFRDKGIDVYGHASISRTQSELAADIEDYNACIPNARRRELHEANIVFADTRIANPNQPLTIETSLDLGHVEVQIIFTPGHTPSNLSAFVPSEGVLYCGDCIVSGYVPNLEGGTRADWKAWLHSLERIAALAPRFVVPGHGHVLYGIQVEQEIERTRQVLKEAIRTGIAPTSSQAS